jgi:uncharacterized protein (TIGR02996 family)
MKHPDWPAFVAAIVAQPDDDTLRLVAADFLEENGDADRAAFIRTQVALAQLEASGLGQSPEARALRKKEWEFIGPGSLALRLWGPEDCPELVRGTLTQAGMLSFRVERVERERLTWQRGFVERVTCPAIEWLRHGAAVRKRNPVRVVILSDCAQMDRDSWSAGLDALRGLRCVDLFYSSPAPQENAVARGIELAEWLRQRLPGTPVNMEFRSLH